MAIQPAPTDPTLDPVTGLPVGADYATQYQIPLNSQPLNLTELSAQGRQSNWIWPDQLIPVLARLQARDLTNEGNAQDLSTDGRRNLNVNIASSSVPSGGSAAWAYTTGKQADSHSGFGMQPFDTIKPAPTKLYSFTGCAFPYDIAASSGSATEAAFTVGYSDYNHQGLYPLFTGMLAFEPDYNPTVYPMTQWSLLWPEGLPVLGTMDDANPFTIWVNNVSFNTRVTYSLLYA